MNYNVTVNGKVYSVTVEKTGAAPAAAPVAAPVVAAAVVGAVPPPHAVSETAEISAIESPNTFFIFTLLLFVF